MAEKTTSQEREARALYATQITAAGHALVRIAAAQKRYADGTQATGPFEDEGALAVLEQHLLNLASGSEGAARVVASVAEKMAAEAKKAKKK